MSNRKGGYVYKALERAEQELRRHTPEAVIVTDTLGQAALPALHRADDPSVLKEYERLATTIRHAQAESSVKTLMLTASVHGEGTTTVATNLALTLASRERLNLLFVESNFRRPALSRLFRTDATAGLTELILKSADWESVVKETAQPNLFLITAGRPPSNPTQLFELDRFAELLEEFRTEFDHTLFDAPPLLPYAEASVLATKVDRVLLVAQAERTRGDSLAQSKEELDKIGAKVLGVVLNRKKSFGPRWLQRYFSL
jgi:capsular exopolysaccharide synthesis family protein